MRKKKKTLLYVAFSVMFSANINSAEMAPVALDKQDKASPVSDSILSKQTETYKQFQQLVSQHKYDEAITSLHVALKLETINILKTAMLLDDYEQKREVFARALELYPPGSEDRPGLYEYAIILAQGQHFSESLTILSNLYAADPTEKRVVYDYIVVLNWSGNNRLAVELYEKHSSGDMPSYVTSSVAGAYYQLGNYKTAQSLFHKVGAAGDFKARLWEAQSYYRLGEVKSADLIYNALLAEKPNDVETLRSRASMLMITRNYRDAVAEFEKILAATADTPDAAEVRKAVDYDMAIAYIRLDEESQAVTKLKPYIVNGTADIFMQSDYILVLRLTDDYKTAISEAVRLWPDYGKVPVFGLQALADSYVRSGVVKKAIPIYEDILRRDADVKSAKLGLAFAKMMAGDISGGSKVYSELLTVDSSVKDIALDDAYYFNEHGRYTAGKALFSLVVNQYPDNVIYRQEYAASLVDNDKPREAYKQYEALSKVTGGETAGLAGMAVAAVQVGDYSQAKNKVSKLQEKYAEDALTLEAVKSWEQRRIGGLEAGFTFYNDYKGLDNQIWRMAGDQSISGRYSVLVEISREKLADKTTDPLEKTILNTQSVGIGYKGIRNDIQAWFHSYKNNGTFSGYSLITNYYPSERLSFGFDVTKTPLLSVQALNPVLAGYNEGRIMTTNYTVRTSIQEGNKNKYDLSLTRSLFSDNNQVNNLDFGWTRTLLFNDKKEQYLFLNCSRESYRLQREDLYQSPEVRTSYALGLTQKWNFPKHYWEGTLALGWGRDKPEPTEFTPYTRLEYGYNFSETRSLTVGVEFGWRTDKLNNSSTLGFGHRQYDLLYKFSW